VTLLEIIREVATRIVAAREEFDPLVREQILEDLEHNVVDWLERFEQELAS
jgi:hypothetical protein